MITPRDYQISAVDKIVDAVRDGINPVCAIATGGGKSICIAMLCQQLSGRVLVVTHRKELIQQNSAILGKYSDVDAGIYSAGVGIRDTDNRVIFAGVQSIYRRMTELQALGEFRYVIVDEAHLVPDRTNEKSMYSQLLSTCPKAQRIGFSATPFRLNDGPIYGSDTTWFDELVYHLGIKDLTQMGYLAPLVGVRTAAKPDLSNVRKQAGEYVLRDLSQASSEESVVDAALDELTYLAQDRKSWLIFGVDRAHGRLVYESLCDRGVSAEFITGQTPAEERADILTRFKSEQFRALVNVEVLTTGFDAPNVDCVALLRATQSRALCIQMLGRGTRLHPGKTDCLTLDMGGNLERHMPLDGLETAYRSPQLAEKEEEEQRRKAHAERERKARHATEAARGLDPLSDEVITHELAKRLDVLDMYYKLKPARRYPERTNLLAFYRCMAEGGLERTVTQFLCIDYPGRPGREARAWFERRNMVPPPSGSMALKPAWRAPKPSQIVVVKDGDWDRILVEQFEEPEEELFNV